MSEQWHGVGPTVTYEVWRSGPNPKAADVRIFWDRTSPESAQEALRICLDDKAEGYPDAAIDFYVVRVTRTREVIAEPDPTLAVPACVEPTEGVAE